MGLRYRSTFRRIGAAAVLTTALAGALTVGGCGGGLEPTTAQTSDAGLTAADHAMLAENCGLPGMRGPDGAPTAQPARVSLPMQQFVSTSVREVSKDGSGQFIIAEYQGLPNGGIARRDHCGKAAVSPISTRWPLYGAFRLRPGVDLSAQYGAARQHMQRHPHRLHTLPAGDYVVVPNVDVVEASKIAAQLAADDLARADGQYFLAAGYAFIPLRD